jgi:hypothetical protein
MFHPGYFVFTSDGMFISYPYYGVVMFDYRGNFIKKLLDVSGPICVLNDMNLCCYDVINHYLVIINVRSGEKKHFKVPLEFQKIWHIQGFSKYVYISLFYEDRSIAEVPLIVKFDYNLGNWEVVLKGDVRESGGMIRVMSDGSILYLDSEKSKLTKILPYKGKYDFNLLNYEPGYVMLSFIVLEKSGRVIIEKYNRQEDLFKIDIFDLKTYKAVVKNVKVPYRLLLGCDDSEKIYIVIDDAVKLNSDQNSKIGVLKLRF